MAAMRREEDGHRKVQSPEELLEPWELLENHQTTVAELLKEQAFTDQDFVVVALDSDLRKKCEDSLNKRCVRELRHMLADSGLADRLTPEQIHVEKEGVVATLLELRADVLSDHRYVGGSFINDAYVLIQPAIEELADSPMKSVALDPHLTMPKEASLLALSSKKVTSSLSLASPTFVAEQGLMAAAQSEERTMHFDQRSCQEPPQEVVPLQPTKEPPPKRVVLDDPTMRRAGYVVSPVAPPMNKTTSSVPSVLPISRTERGLLTITQCVEARIVHCYERMTIHAENAYDSWAVVTFNTLSSGDFDIELTLLADAPCTDPWDNWFVLGAVPAGTSALELSAAEAPWHWGCFLTPFNAPMEVWSGFRGREQQPCKLRTVTKRLLAAQSLRMRCTAGRMSFGVDRGTKWLLPSHVQRNEPMVPCLILGMATKVVVGRVSA